MCVLMESIFARYLLDLMLLGSHVTILAAIVCHHSASHITWYATHSMATPVMI